MELIHAHVERLVRVAGPSKGRLHIAIDICSVSAVRLQQAGGWPLRHLRHLSVLAWTDLAIAPHFYGDVTVCMESVLTVLAA